MNACSGQHSTSQLQVLPSRKSSSCLPEMSGQRIMYSSQIPSSDIATSMLFGEGLEASLSAVNRNYGDVFLTPRRRLLGVGALPKRKDLGACKSIGMGKRFVHSVFEIHEAILKMGKRGKIQSRRVRNH